MSDTDILNLRPRLEALGQAHVLNFIDSLPESGRLAFVEELVRVDWELVGSLVAGMTSGGQGKVEKFEPAVAIERGQDVAADLRMRELGEDILREGRLAVFVVAGGQGSRLGFDGPKGVFPSTPIRGNSLFQVYAEKIAALQYRFGHTIPWFVMTSRSNHEQTIQYFEANNHFGLDAESLFFFSQEMLPAVDRDGRALLSSRGSLFLSPNGHGGSLLALKNSGALETMRKKGIEEIFYFQVDNPLVVMADPLFLGYHATAKAEMSSKVVLKRDPEERVGIVGMVNGRFGVIEYSDLSEEQRHERDVEGRLRFGDGNIATHFIRRDFVESVTSDGLDLPYHLASKEITCIDPETGDEREVEGVKFETFVFDALSRCSSSVVLSVERSDEFAPIKNAKGDDSPESSRQAQSRLQADLLATMGFEVPRDSEGFPRQFVEISPLVAENPEALANIDLSSLVVDAPIDIGA